jgi:dCMP deaminase
MSNLILDRPTWDEYFLKLADTASLRSSCPSRKVGAVIVNPETKQVVSLGYNGAARGAEHCTELCLTREKGKDWDKCNAIHAELNAIIAAAMNGVSTNGATIYLTTTPCVFCARHLVNAGIKRVVASSLYLVGDSLNLLAKSGIKVDIFTENLRSQNENRYI